LSAGADIRGLYLHTPFCFHKCHYCDFYSIADPPQAGAEAAFDRQQAFATALLAEIDLFSEECLDLTPDTVFIGGGTPTLLADRLWERILGHLGGRGWLDRIAEFTVEANPETVSADLMAILRAGDVNRISIGAQTFNPRHLQTLERWHEPESVARAVGHVRGAGIHEINLDLIFAIPGQTLRDVETDVDIALSLRPTHLSCYSLIYEPNTAMTQRLKMGQFEPAAEELEREMFALVQHKLAGAGFEHYEVSNWARVPTPLPSREGPFPTPLPSREGLGEGQTEQMPRTQLSNLHSHRCRHNLIYWHNENWLGAGPSAASHVAGVRWKNEPHLGRYLAGSPRPPLAEYEQLPPARVLGEQLMLGLRLLEGVRRTWLSENIPPDDPRHTTIGELTDLGLLEITPTHLRLTSEGLFVADAVIAKLL